MPKGIAGRTKEVESIVRACRLLSAFGKRHSALRLQDLADFAELAPSTALRLLRTLEKCGFVRREPSGRYRSNIALAAASKYRIGYVVDSEGRRFRQEVSLGLAQAADEHNVELLSLDHRGDRRRAVRDAEWLIRAGAQLVIDFQTGYDVAHLVAEKYLEAGIPMIAVDTPHPGATFVGVNNYVAGRDGGRWMGEWVKRGWGGVDMVVHGSAGLGAVTASRIRGAIAGLKEKLGAGSRFAVQELETSSSMESNFHAVQRWLGKSKKGRTIVLMATDPGVIGSLTALEEAGSRMEAAVFGFGGNHETRMSLRAPATKLAGCVGFRPEVYGERLVKTAIRILENRPTPPAIFVEHLVLHAGNVDHLYPYDSAM
jgi:ribose transport system substrate-binding protein